LGLALLAYLSAAFGASAERRVALVIGNSDYRNVPRLPNPANDAAAVAEMFRAAQFDDVQMQTDLGIADLRRVLGSFTDTAAGADTVVIYYAGHGMEIDGNNYIIPVDAKLARDFDVDDETISLDRILRSIEPAHQLRLVILDACRDNPFLKTMKRSLGSRSIARGLAKVEPTVPDTLVAFAAKAGSVAFDGQEPNSPFTAALLKHIPTPGLDIRLAFGRVRDDVMTSTSQKQEPFVYGSLGGKTVSIVHGPSDEATPPKQLPGSQEAAEAWNAIKETTSVHVLEAFVSRYGSSFYAELARDRIIQLQGSKPVLQTRPIPADEVGKGTKPSQEEASQPKRKKTIAQVSGGLHCGPNGTGVGTSQSNFVACQHRKYTRCRLWETGTANCLQWR
jgi:uncharacterized caspase-like protein